MTRVVLDTDIFSEILKARNTFDENCAITAGRIFADLEKTGQPIGRADPMIAAIAMQHNLVVVTGNTAHYERIQKLGYSLRLDNWR
jgi:predicted nucleic acid-binding protein